LKQSFSNRVRKGEQYPGMTTLGVWHYEYSSHEPGTTKSDGAPMGVSNTYL